MEMKIMMMEKATKNNEEKHLKKTRSSINSIAYLYCSPAECTEHSCHGETRINTTTTTPKTIVNVQSQTFVILFVSAVNSIRLLVCDEAYGFSELFMW